MTRHSTYCLTSCYEDKEVVLANIYENEILDLIDHQGEFTRSDLQGAVQALVIKIMTGNKK